MRIGLRDQRRSIGSGSPRSAPGRNARDAALAALFALGSCTDQHVRAARAWIEVDPLSLDFGDLAIGTAKPLSLTVTNSGTRDLVINASAIEGDERGAFTADALPPSIWPGGHAAIGVVYVSTAQGADGAALVISSNAENAPEARVSLSGRTISNCTEGLLDCLGRCVNPKTDANHCGGCDRACEPHFACRDSRCVCEPATCEGLGACGSLSDGCGGELDCPACSAPAECVQNRCVPPACDDSRMNGDETDVDCGGPTCPGCGLGRDCAGGADCGSPLGCVSGKCGACTASEECRPGLACVAGLCWACTADLQCPAGQTCSAGTCTPCAGATGPIDTRTDPRNCGACGHLCPEPAHAEARCAAGVCGRGLCADGFFDIDGDATFGCESSCVDRVCNDGAGHTVVVTNDPIPEGSFAFPALASGSSFGAEVQTSAGYTNMGVLGEPTPPAAGGAVEQKNAAYRNIGGLNAVQR